jgi:hypothetical protein
MIYTNTAPRKDNKALARKRRRTTDLHSLDNGANRGVNAATAFFRQGARQRIVVNAANKVHSSAPAIFTPRWSSALSRKTRVY